MAHNHSDYFVSTEQAHYGFIRSRASLLLFLFGMYFLYSTFSITPYKPRSRALCTQSKSGSLESPKLHRALAVPCVKSRARDSHKGATDVALLCPTVKTSCALCSSMWLSGGLAITPIKAGLQGLQKQGGKRLLPWASHLRGKWVFCAFCQRERSTRLTLWAAYCALGPVRGVEDSVGKSESDIGFVPMELTF